MAISMPLPLDLYAPADEGPIIKPPTSPKIVAESDYCISCEERSPRNECPESERDCGHHCNHSWSHDGCDWCAQEWM